MVLPSIYAPGGRADYEEARTQVVKHFQKSIKQKVERISKNGFHHVKE